MLFAWRVLILFPAGPCKARKLECSKVVDSLCENCVQREIRFEMKDTSLYLYA